MGAHALDVRVEHLNATQWWEWRLDRQLGPWNRAERIIRPPPGGRLSQPDRGQDRQHDQQESADDRASGSSHPHHQRGVHDPEDLVEPTTYLAPTRSVRTSAMSNSAPVARESASGPLEPGRGGNPPASKMRATALCCEKSVAITRTVPSGLMKGKDPGLIPPGTCDTGIHRSWLGSYVHRDSGNRILPSVSSMASPPPIAVASCDQTSVW